MKLTRAQFTKRLRELADEMDTDHEESTGVTSSAKHSFGYWMADISACHYNTSDDRE